MSSNHICRSCLRAMRPSRSQLRDQLSTSRTNVQRALSSSATRSQNSAQRAQQESTNKAQSVSDMQRYLQQRTGGSANSRSPLTAENIAKRIQKAAPDTVETYHAYGATETFIENINAIVGYDVPQAKSKGKEEVPKLDGGEDVGVAIGEGQWYKELRLHPTFNNWAQLTMLHLYVLVTRIRCLPAANAATWTQHLTDHYFREAEERMETLHSITARGIRSKYLKDLFQQWRGVLVAYDEGLVKGDAVLASAVWRNLFGGKEDVDPVRLAMVVAWLRREVRRVSEEGNATLWGRFGDLKSEEPVVLMKSHYMDKPLSMDPAAARPARAAV